MLETPAPTVAPDWEALNARIRACTRCSLCATRTQAVPGFGCLTARLMLVGEAPGANEDLQGKPFVGAAGKLLTELLGSIGIERDDVYIANVLKCRPPNNRNPLPEEVEACLPYLRRQVSWMRPTVIVTMGNFALKALIDPNIGITAARGRFYQKGAFTFFATFHPAAALYTPAKKALMQQDFLALGEYLKTHQLMPQSS